MEDKPSRMNSFNVRNRCKRGAIKAGLHRVRRLNVRLIIEEVGIYKWWLTPSSHCLNSHNEGFPNVVSHWQSVDTLLPQYTNSHIFGFRGGRGEFFGINNYTYHPQPPPPPPKKCWIRTWWHPPPVTKNSHERTRWHHWKDLDSSNKLFKQSHTRTFPMHLPGMRVAGIIVSRLTLNLIEPNCILFEYISPFVLKLFSLLLRHTSHSSLLMSAIFCCYWIFLPRFALTNTPQAWLAYAR